MRNTLRALAALGVVSLLIGCGGNEPSEPTPGCTHDCDAVGFFVESDPPDAEVFVDDEATSRGTTPLELQLTVGRHTLRLELPGRMSETREVDVGPEGGSIMVTGFQPMPAETGFLAVSLDPPLDVEARVVLNGETTDIVIRGAEQGLVEVDPTVPHDVGLAISGFLGVEQLDVTCSPGATVPVAIPIGADVDGQFRGSVDGRIVEVESGVGGGVVYLQVVNESGYTVKGFQLFIPETSRPAGTISSDRNSFHLSVDGYEEDYTRL